MDATTRGGNVGQRDMTEFASDLWGESGMGFIGETAVAAAKMLWRFVAKPPEAPATRLELPSEVDRDAPTEVDE